MIEPSIPSWLSLFLRIRRINGNRKIIAIGNDKEIDLFSMSIK